MIQFYRPPVIILSAVWPLERTDATSLKETIFLWRRRAGATTKKLRNDGRMRQTSLTCLTSVEAAVSRGRLVMQMANAAPRDAAWHPGGRHHSSGGGRSAAPSRPSETTTSFSLRFICPLLYTSDASSAAEIWEHLIRGWRVSAAGLRTCCTNTDAHNPGDQHGPSRLAGFMWKAFSSTEAAEDTSIVELRDGWSSYVSVSAEWNTAEFIRLQISKVTASRWNPRKPNPFSKHTRKKAQRYGQFENIETEVHLQFM